MSVHNINKYCNNGGCMAKLGPKFLDKVLDNLPTFSNDNLLVGFESSDDASIYKINDTTAIVQTLDFFTPMVDDPYIFGQIASANALSDIYAMGGDVTTALNIVCFPENEDPNILGEILRGGADKVREAGGILTGGHSVNDNDIKYGMSVSGVVSPTNFYRNNSTKVGDKIIMTKSLGVSIALTANKVNLCSKQAYEQAIKQMITLNKYTKDIMVNYNVNAVTDITGFGFLGHLHEMINNNSIVINTKDINYISDVYEYANDFIITSGGQRNRKFLGDKIKFEIDDFPMEEILFDPQTSGGFIISVDASDANNLLIDLLDNNITASIVGEVVSKNKEHSIIIK